MPPTPVAPAHTPLSLTLFCKVFDNYGDIGICWRLARQFQHEHHIAVTLWVDDLESFQRICPELVIDADVQQVAAVTIRRWRDQIQVFAPTDIADIVIEFFGCDIPPGYIKAMSQCTPQPVWLNLEGLTAQTWVEGCHTLASPHPTLPLTKHFFFPGFTSRTGGLLAEANIQRQRLQFQNDPATVSAFLGHLGLTSADMAAFKISLFCYPHAPIAALFAAWQKNTQAITCLVPEGVGGAALESFLGQAPRIGTSICRGALTVRILPFVPQPDYDKLLWACDLNFVRGEDSFVRAQWACQPFVWHIYPQDANLHHIKLNAFLGIHDPATEALTAFTLAWNAAIAGDIDWLHHWRALAADIPKIAEISPSWQQRQLTNGDLASNLLRFAQTLAAGTRQN